MVRFIHFIHYDAVAATKRCCDCWLILLLVKICLEEVEMNPTFCEAKNSLRFQSEFSEKGFAKFSGHLNRKIRFARISQNPPKELQFLKLISCKVLVSC